jgi:hypothetical protein
MSWKDRRKACQQRSKDDAPTTDGRSLHPNESEEAMPAKTDEAPDIEPIVVLDLIMPNGKRMRDCTGEIRRPSPKARRVFAEASRAAQDLWGKP